MRTDDLRAELAQLRDEVQPFTPDALAIHRTVRRRRIAVRTAAAVLALIVATGVALSVRDTGKKRVEVVNSPKLERSLADFGRIDYVLFGSDLATIQQRLDETTWVTKYAVLPAGMQLGGSNGVFPYGGAWKDALCRLRKTDGIAIQIDDDVNPRSMRSSWGEDSKLIDVRPNHHIDAEIFMNADATSAQTQAVAAALAADDTLSVPATFVDREAAYQIFKEDFANQPALIKSTKPSDLPESFQLHLKNDRDAAALVKRYEALPAVDTVINEHQGRLPLVGLPSELTQGVENADC